MKRLFLTMVDQHQQLVYSQAMFILANKADAEDATQETYERFWAALNKPRPGKEFTSESAKAWLLHVVRNLCIDKLRRRKPTTTQELDEFENQSSHSKPVTELMSKQMNSWLGRAIKKLKEPYRSLIILADLQQRSIKDVARTLNLNENQAKVYIHRGRRQLRGFLQGIEL
ncbi:RNA polymerase sigma factor [Arenicella xantha]|uniref:RNA polymerase sigma-70 factor (ECF subfamily) n=1 Tax=Arenicella xantha TaxID=644221 RepID=A0A395JRD3_9GAMM|nr:sigma-70 family RNA polymerase sigma factor [Arenicella xantha]RBP51260.1 RNA polymerase sigma-70 factor (ECF subfamily) [Arenicella xantha]